MFTDLDTVLGPHAVLRPDILVVLSAFAHRITPTHVQGAADLVVEIVSPGSRQRDHGDQQVRYWLGGVAEYWIVDPDAGAVAQLVREPEHCRQRATSGDQIDLPVLPGVAVALHGVW